MNTNVKMMGTTKRHMRILSYLDKIFVERALKDELEYAREQVALVQNKDRLIDLAEISNSSKQVLKDNINQLKISYPDFMVFKENEVLENKTGTRFAGIPDLIIEVWSPFNSEKEKEEKRKLYITNKSHFWEFEQESMTVTCWDSSGMQYFQSLDRPLTTPWGEALDLIAISHEVRHSEPNDRYHGGEDVGIDLDL